MELQEVMLYVSITGLIVGCYIASIKQLYKCKFTSLSCCGIQVTRNVDIEMQIEEGQLRRESSATPVLTNIFR